MYVHTRAYAHGICMGFYLYPAPGVTTTGGLGLRSDNTNLDSSEWSINETDYDGSAADSPGCEGG